MHRPRLLFLDEPTAGVDLRNRALFWEIIQEEADAGVTVFVTTHFLEEVELCDWVSFIDAGRLIADAAPEDLRARFADGYRVRVAADLEARETVARALADVSVALRETDDGFTFSADTLDDRTLSALERVGELDRVVVRIEQPEMTDIFRQLIGANGAVR